MPQYVYRCEQGHERELLRPRTVETVSCPCGGMAERQSVYRIGVSGFAATPAGESVTGQDYRRFREAAQTLAYQQDRLSDSAQVRFTDPPLSRVARSNAQKLDAAGVTADSIST